MSSSRNNPGTASAPTRYPGSFFLAFREAALGMDLTPVRWLGDAVVLRDKDRAESTIGLENLFRRCKQHERGQWVEVIRDFLKYVGPAPDQEPPPDDLHAVADRLMPRLGAPMSHQEAVKHIWWQQLDPERLWLNLVIDYPNRMMFVSQELVEKSGQPGEYWLARALDNLRARSNPEMIPVIHDASGIRMIQTGDSYEVARTLILDDLLPETRDTGFFVAPVGRENVFVLPTTMKVLQQVHILKLLARDNYPKVPYSISDEVFWVHQGKWYHFPIDFKDKSIVVQPPQEFLAALNMTASSEESAEEAPPA